ncbi:MAG TPA: DUF2877 domain-containing protein, partial [Propionibacteriaceae bacterium]|nr:DUF2877 domain-containing protein [Propionibacteriaceae bacterium]
MSTSTTDRALVAQVRQYTEPASHAMSAAGGRGVVVGRYTRSVAVVVSDAVVQVTDGMIDSPIAARVDTATLDALQDGIDDVALVLSSRASLVPTLLLPGSAVPARRRLELLREAAGVYAADSWLATTPAQLSGARHLAAVVASLTAGSGIDEPALVSIVGRGAGLTPAGDDAIVGVLAASMAAGRLEEADRRHLLRLLDTRGRELTTPVSYTILRCAAA